MSLINSALSGFEEVLRVRNERMEVIGKNIANADTPHFKAQDVDFKTVLNHANSAQAMVTTDARHYDLGDAATTNGLKYRVPFNPSFDGNTVELQVEQAQFGKAAADYQATLTFLENRVGGLRRALKGE